MEKKAYSDEWPVLQQQKRLVFHWQVDRYLSVLEVEPFWDFHSVLELESAQTYYKVELFLSRGLE